MNGNSKAISDQIQPISPHINTVALKSWIPAPLACTLETNATEVLENPCRAQSHLHRKNGQHVIKTLIMFSGHSF